MSSSLVAEMSIMKPETHHVGELLPFRSKNGKAHILVCIEPGTDTPELRREYQLAADLFGEMDLAADAPEQPPIDAD